MEIQIGNTNIQYTDVGSGDPVVMLHGWGSCKEAFGRVITTVAEKYRVIAPDLPGFGKSSEPPKVWDVDGFADMVVRFVSALGLRKIILLGHSFGGRISIKLCARDDLPFEIEKLILVDSAGIMPRRSIGYKMRVGAYKAAKKFMSTSLMRKLSPDGVEKMQAKRGSSDYRNASPVMKGCLVKAVNEDLEPLLGKISVETLLIWGTKDDATPIGDAKIMEKKIPNAGLAEINGAGHFSWLDSPAVFDAIIRSYLKI